MEESQVNGEQMLVTDQYAAELTEPGVGAFDLPASFVASQFAAIFVSPLRIVFSVGCDQLDASPFSSLPQRVGVVAAISDHSFGLLLRPTLRSRGTDLIERGARRHNFCRKRHIPAEFPAEHLHRLPVPSTLCLYRAWFCRLHRPFWRAQSCRGRTYF